MRSLIILLGLAVFSYAAPQLRYFPIQNPYNPGGNPIIQLTRKPIAILRMNQDVNYDGSYSYGFESENGIKVQSSGTLRDRGTKDEVQVAAGSYTYVSPEGKRITTNWYADDTGFHAEGGHIPSLALLEIVRKKL